jgi:Domain of unknown function (DUF4184)
MPWIVPSHQAVVLPLKAWRPHLFSGFGLVLGSMAPDLAFILMIDKDSVAAHTFPGQLYVTVPLVLVLHAVATRWVFPWLLPLLPVGRPFCFERLGAIASAGSAREWLRVAASGWIGGMTHVAIDGFTHGNHSGWAREHFPGLAAPVGWAGASLPLHDALQIGLTIVFGAVTLMAWPRLLHLCPQPPGGTRAPASLRRGLGVWMLACAVLGAAVGAARRPEAAVAVRAEIALFGALAFVAYGLVLGGLLQQAAQGAGRRVRPRPLQQSEP